MIEDRLQAVDFAKTTAKAVVDSTTPFMQLLNANSYQKGGWVLHMLRNELGDSVFHQVIRQYYKSFAGRNADTRDFERVCEVISHRDLSGFFRQWLYTPGCPDLQVKWTYHPEKNKVNLEIRQLQKTPFAFPLTVRVQTAKGPEDHTVYVRDSESQSSFAVSSEPTSVSLDPNTVLLYQGQVTPSN
jgi:aminopeptidase N